MFWQINRPIRIEFNHAIDPDSINFGTVQIRSTDPAAAGNPVTGTFEIEAGSLGRALIFRPTCPTDDFNSNGAFLPGEVGYELVLPTRDDSLTVLRDTTGHSLSGGLRRTFNTPPLTQPAFLDLVQGPVAVTSVDFPEGLNFFADSDPVIEIRFNQPIDGRSVNLNTDNLFVLYSNGELGSGNEDLFDATNKVPGQLVLIENCTVGGAFVEFRITGLLPVNRNLRLVMSNQFGDLIGQVNTAELVVGTHATPTLTAVYNDPTWVETDETVDEFRDDFDTSQNLALDEPIPVPLAQVSDGFIAASFDYPGNFVAADNNFFLAAGVSSEIFTDSQSSITDSNNRQHPVQSGVMNVNNFTIEATATLRGRGANPLVIFATGEVVINGILDASGNNATWPTSLNSPQFVEGGAGGECGGGRGGDASQIGNAETPRALPGDGPFFIVGGGGGGGEGGFNGDSTTSGIFGLNHTVVAGGGGGGFALTENEAVLWTGWSAATGWVPSGVDNNGPDHRVVLENAGDHAHTQMVPEIGITAQNPNGNGIFGAEDGIRGVNSLAVSGVDVDSGPLGMEDALMEVSIDTFAAQSNQPNYDPAWTTGTTPPFLFGSPTAGPDPGLAGPTPFNNDLTGLNTLNDFWGSRLMRDGTVTRGELLTPWAGAGGGGSGDSMLIEVNNGDPLLSLYPVVPFQKSAGGQGWDSYRKGAGGGGGGGQVLIMAIGTIRLGAVSRIKVNGGIGFSGESLIFSDNGISGSGAGAGGHLVLHSSTGLDLSAISVGTAANAAQIVNLSPANNIQAFGGRRGWAGPSYSTHLAPPGNGRKDGNDTFAVGRGGAGANGVIQIHVPNPLTDIIWHPSSEAGILDFISVNTGVGEEPTDSVEEMLSLYTAPTAYSLIPFFSSQSMVVSEWIDTGLAELRLEQPAAYPKYGDPLLDFNGINPANGEVGRSGQFVLPLADIATGGTGLVTFEPFSLTIPSASTLFEAKFTRLPNLLIGYDVLPSATATSTFEIVSATYSAGTDTLVLTSAVGDGPMTFALDGGNPTWSVREKFFRVDTVGAKNSLPSSTSITFEFQGADEDPALPAGSGQPGDPIDVGGEVWHTNLDFLDGQRFIRYRVTFNADAQANGIDLASPLPAIDYVKVPILW
ncbi:MAG: hypothetical protein O3A95_08155 [Planctomycetota bacterium]|nr:hypothetical protein [Planctomycetota bacterium]MDA1114255.1 hypothetical protein [Planctomycetota bacterium]